jgi:hypothetical protein
MGEGIYRQIDEQVRLSYIFRYYRKYIDSDSGKAYISNILEI